MDEIHQQINEKHGNKMKSMEKLLKIMEKSMKSIEKP